MSLTAPGADLTLTRRPETGKFDLQWDSSQNPVFGDDQSHAVLSLILEQRGKYWGDSTRVRGSLLYTVRDAKKAAESRAVGFIIDALQPLVDAGKIKMLPGAVTATLNAVNRSRLDVSVTYSTPGGRSVTVRPNLGY